RGRQPTPKGTLARIARSYDRPLLLGGPKQALLRVKTQTGLAGSWIRSVTRKTVLGQNRSDIPIELEGSLRDQARVDPKNRSQRSRIQNLAAIDQIQISLTHDH